MINKTPINYFVNGYSVETGGSCIDLPIAIVCGTIKELFYYMYLFSQVMYKNWGIEPQSQASWINHVNLFLNKMGLKLCCYHNNWTQSLEIIKHNINNGYPVLIPVSYHTLFYYLEYNEKTPHILIINGYDNERNLLLVCDCNIVDHGLELKNPKYTIYQLPLTCEIFRSIWIKSNLFFESSYQDFYNNQYIIKRINTDSIFSFNYYLESTIKNCSPENNLLIANLEYLFIKKDKDNPDTINEIFRGLRRDFLGQLKVLFDTLIICTPSNCFSQIEKIKKCYDSFYNYRNTLLSRLQIDLLRKKEFNIDYFETIKNQIMIEDSNLFLFLNDLKF